MTRDALYLAPSGRSPEPRLRHGVANSVSRAGLGPAGQQSLPQKWVFQGVDPLPRIFTDAQSQLLTSAAQQSATA